ncbi:MAG: glycosyltransferase [Hyphomicrobiaceae bacterium]
MDILFVHNNFPAQFKGLAAALTQIPGTRVAAIGSRGASEMERVKLQRYEVMPADLSETHPFARRFDVECRRAEQILYAATALIKQGFTPNVVIAHCGWGETLPLREAFPRARIITYCEFYYRSQGLDVNFDPEFGYLGVDACVGLQLKNAATLLSLIESDDGIAPTLWQRSTYPTELQSKITVLHEGVDINAVRPDANAVLTLPNGRRLARGQEIVTFVARNLEPLRGYHIFMRAVPEILRQRPNAQIVIVGDDKVSYGAAPPPGRNWKTIFRDEVAARIDPNRVHFLGPLPYASYLKMLQVSSVHVYLTYPFVLSWSMIESLSAGCVVIGSDTGPLHEVIDGQNGMLVPFFDIEGLAGRVCHVLANQRAYDPMRAAARATAVNRFSLDACVAGLVDFVAH